MEDERRHPFAGFPSPAADYKQPQLNLHALLVRRLLSTFFARFEGDAMVGERIFDQDLLVIERVSEYTDGQIVLAFVDGERLVRKLHKHEGRLFLCPANGRYREIDLTEEVQIFGRVLHSITHHFRITQLLPAAR